jgi:signal transduction histidine kinase
MGAVRLGCREITVMLPAGKHSAARSGTSIAGVLAMSIGLLVLVGWELDAAWLMRGWPDLPATKRLTALLLVVAGLILLRLPKPGETRPWRTCESVVLAGIMALVALLELADAALQWDTYLHGTWLVAAADDGRASHTLHAGQMALPTVVAFLTFGLAMVIRATSWRWRHRLLCLLLMGGLAMACLGALAMIYGVPDFSTIGGENAMALPTALGVGISFLGLAAACPKVCFVQVLQSHSPAGRLTRSLLPLSVILPPLLGYTALRLASDMAEKGHVLALSTLFICLVFGVITLWLGQRLLAAEQADRAAHDEIIQLNAALEAKVTSRNRELAQVNHSLEQQREVLVRQNQELVQLAQELRRSNEDLQHFAFATSHDLQEPLRGIIGCLELLDQSQGQRLPADDRELLVHAVQASERLQHLIAGLLAYSRVGSQGLVCGQHELSELVATVRENLAVTLRERQAEITVTAACPIPGDANQLLLVLQNLVSNGIKFNRQAQPRITISAQPVEQGVELRVEDNGIGIEPHFHDRLFQLFQRLHPASQFTGSGVGLAVCRRIVERHRGRVWLTSMPGQGTCFFVFLPHCMPTCGKAS